MTENSLIHRAVTGVSPFKSSSEVFYCQILFYRVVTTLLEILMVI